MSELEKGYNLCIQKCFTHQRKRMALALLIVFFLGSNSASSFGQNICESEEIKEAVRRNAHLSSAVKIPLLVTALPKLKEDLIRIMIEEIGNESRKVQHIEFCEVMPAIYDIQNGIIVSETVELDNDSAWIVATGLNRSTYLLAGFSSPHSSFNQLTKDLGIKVDNPETALEIFDLFLKTARGQQFRFAVVADKMKLQSIALEDFRLRYPIAKRQAAFDRWWKGVPLNLKERLISPKVRSEDNGFRITYYRYSKGSVLEESVFISNQAVVHDGASKVLYSEEAIPIKKVRRVIR